MRSRSSAPVAGAVLLRSLCAAALLRCAPSSPVAGGAGSEVGNPAPTACIHGTVRDSAGAPRPGALVRLLRTDFDPLAAAAAGAPGLVDTTDSAGSYAFTVDTAADYNILAFDPASGYRAIVQNLAPEPGDTAAAPPARLQAPARVRVPAPEVPGEGHVYLPGTLAGVNVDSAAVAEGFLTLDSVPAGLFDIALGVREAHVTVARCIFSEVKVNGGRSVTVERPTGRRLHVSTTGSDSGSGTDALPWRTIQYAVDNAGAGDTVAVAPGSYAERVEITGGGSAGAPVVVRSDSLHGASTKGFRCVDAHYVRIERFAVVDETVDPGATPGIAVSGTGIAVLANRISNTRSYAIRSVPHHDADNIYLAANTIERCGAGICLLADNCIVDDNTIERVVDYGVTVPDYVRFFGVSWLVRRNHLHGAVLTEIDSFPPTCFQTFDNNGETAQNVLIEANRCFDFGWALALQSLHHRTSRSILIRNNLFVGGTLGAVHVWGIPDVKVLNNTFVDVGPKGVRYEDKGATGGLIRNNVFCSLGPVYEFIEGATAAYSHNLLYNTPAASPPSPDDLVDTNPLFADSVGGDFSLSVLSPAIDAGAHAAAVTTDIDGTMRPRGNGWDIGAYESQ